MLVIKVEAERVLRMIHTVEFLLVLCLVEAAST